jgi:hypothetical protein
MAVYFYKPPTYRMVQTMQGSLRYGVNTSTTVYRLNGTWFNVQDAGMDAPVITDVDVDAATGLRLYFTKPMVVPDTIYAELSALTPADPSWTPGTLTLL